MEKARLTKAQAEALDVALQHKTAEEVVEYHAASERNWDFRRAPLSGLTTDEICRALYVGYEIIEPDHVVTVTAEMRKTLRISREAYGPDTTTAIWNKDVWYKRGFDNALDAIGIKL